MLDTCGVKIWLPGITDTATLKMASELCGQASFTERVRIHGRGSDRGEHRRIWHDVMTPDMIRQLPAGYALVVRSGYAPVIARLAAAWKDRTYRSARRHGVAVADLRPAPALAGRPGRQITARSARQQHLTVVPDPDEALGGAASGGYPWS